MKKKTGIHFRLNERLDLVIDDYRGKSVRHKTISLDELCKVVQGNLSNKVSSGMLPKGCISYSKNVDGSIFVVMELTEDRVNITYENTRYENFPMPRLLFGFSLTPDYRITSVRTTVAPLGQLREDTILYKYPFSNVLEFDMCIGTNSMPHIKSLRQLNGIPYYIFAMPDNNDYYKKGNTKLSMEYRTLLETLKNKDSKFYYDSVLVESNKTLKDFINL